VEELLAERGMILTDETVRQWGTVKLSTFDGNDDSKVGNYPCLRAVFSPQAQYLGRSSGSGGEVSFSQNIT